MFKNNKHKRMNNDYRRANNRYVGVHNGGMELKIEPKGERNMSMGRSNKTCDQIIN